jgi:hypothetical protein
MPHCTLHLLHDPTCDACGAAYIREKGLLEALENNAEKHRTEEARKFFDRNVKPLRHTTVLPGS